MARWTSWPASGTACPRSGWSTPATARASTTRATWARVRRRETFSPSATPTTSRHPAGWRRWPEPRGAASWWPGRWTSTRSIRPAPAPCTPGTLRPPWTRIGFLPYAPGGNCGVWTAVALEVGWDEAFQFGSSDIEFSWRVQLARHRLAFAPDAVIHQRLDGRLGELRPALLRLRESDPQLFRRFRDLGMPRPDALTPLRWLASARPGPGPLRSHRPRELDSPCRPPVRPPGGSAENRVLVR